MQYPSQFQPQGSPPRSRGIIWVLVGVVVILTVTVAVVVTVLVTKSDTASTPSTPGVGIATQGTDIPQDTQAPLADVYIGQSLNRTVEQLGVDGSATIELRFTDKSPQALAGEIEVNGRNVGGTGLFKGSLRGNRIELKVLPEDGVPSFELTATIREDGSMDGVLTVPGSAGDIAQTGEWQASPQR